jgi:hypothetical protein
LFLGGGGGRGGAGGGGLKRGRLLQKKIAGKSSFFFLFGSPKDWKRTVPGTVPGTWYQVLVPVLFWYQV